MKKLFLFCLIAVAAAFVSCSKDEDKAGNIVGKWEVYKAADIEGDQEFSEEYGQDGYHHWLFEFRSNGTGVDTKIEEYYGGWQKDEYSFTYSASKKTLRIKYEDEDYSDDYTIEKLTSSELVISFKDGIYGGRLYMKRIN